MQLPPQLRSRIEDLAERFPFSELRAAVERLTAAYQAGKPASHALSDLERTAYLLVRFPATYAACRRVLSEVAEVIPAFSPQSLLDLGSGPGTAIAAAHGIFPSITSIQAIERDAGMAMLDDVLGASVKIHRQPDDLERAQFRSADLVTMSYALGEIPTSNRGDLIGRAWQVAQQTLVVIEPGTPEGYGRILQVREQLLGAGGHVVAPCPHAERCPMVGTKDWCHFAARVERASLHRRLKGGSLGHEDEKFSYVAFTRLPLGRPQARIVRHPMQGQGHVRLQLCVDGAALRSEVIARSNKALYKAARQAQWGDAWPPILNEDADGRHP